MVWIVLVGCDRQPESAASDSQASANENDGTALNSTERVKGPEVDVKSLKMDGETWTQDGSPFTGVALMRSKDGSSILRRWEMKDGAFHGLIEEWWDNGNKMTETNFVEGKRHGENRYWYKDGKLQKLQIYEHGVSKSEEIYPQ